MNREKCWNCEHDVSVPDEKNINFYCLHCGSCTNDKTVDSITEYESERLCFLLEALEMRY